MLVGYSPLVQSVLGTLFTWLLTAAGAACVFFVPRNLHTSTLRAVINTSLGFAAGVMLAASFWSLLAPAIEVARESGMYGRSGEYAWAPVTVGFLVGGWFIHIADRMLPDETIDLAVAVSKHHGNGTGTGTGGSNSSSSSSGGGGGDDNDSSKSSLRHRRSGDSNNKNTNNDNNDDVDGDESMRTSRRRLFLLIVAVTVHNFPEGLAVGVGFGSVGTTSARTFAEARKLAIGIGLQNFPEGLAVSLPLMKLGFPRWLAFFYGQLSGLVEVFAGVLGAVCVAAVTPLLPYALSFAAGAMIYVVVHDLIPEASKPTASGSLSQHASLGAMIGFAVMMAMDVGL